MTIDTQTPTDTPKTDQLGTLISNLLTICNAHIDARVEKAMLQHLKGYAHDFDGTLDQKIETALAEKLNDASITASLLATISDEHEEKIKVIAQSVMEEHTNEYDHDKYERVGNNIEEIVTEAAEEVFSNYDFSSQIESAIDEYDMTSKVEEVIGDKDLITKAALRRLFSDYL